MAFCHTGMSGKSLGTEYLATYRAVPQVGLCPMTMDAGGVTTVDADVVQHRRLLHKLYVHWQFLVLCHDSQTTVSNLSRVYH